MEEKEVNIADLTRVTAKNIYDLMMNMADHMQSLQRENQLLKQELEAYNDDLK